MPGKASQRGLPEPLFAGAAVLEATLKRLHAAEGRLWEMSHAPGDTDMLLAPALLQTAAQSVGETEAPTSPRRRDVSYLGDYEGHGYSAPRRSLVPPFGMPPRPPARHAPAPPISPRGASGRGALSSPRSLPPVTDRPATSSGASARGAPAAPDDRAAIAAAAASGGGFGGGGSARGIGGGPAGVKELYAQNALLDIDWGRLRDGSLESPLAKRVGPLLQASLPNTENGEVAEPRFGPVAGDTSWCAKFATI